MKVALTFFVMISGLLFGTNGCLFGQDSLSVPKLEVPPLFPGGEAALFKYLSNTIKYPELCRENGIEGVVYISYTIKSDGTVSDVVVERGVEKVGGQLINEEAKRVVQGMPRWEPGILNGKPVRVKMQMPIKFKLEGGNPRAERRALKAKAKEAARLAKEKDKQEKKN